MVDVDRVYEELVRALSPGDQLRLAARIVSSAAANVEASHATSAAPVNRPSPADRERWSKWLEETLRVGEEQLAAEQREMKARGILDAEGRLTAGELPEDMRPGSTTSVATG